MEWPNDLGEVPAIGGDMNVVPLLSSDWLNLEGSVAPS